MNHNLYLNTVIKSDQSSLMDHLGNKCFAPMRCLWDGREIEILDGEVIAEFPCVLETKWKKTAYVVSAVLLIPAFILGTIAKILAYCRSSTRKEYAIVRAYDQQPSLPLPEFDHLPFKTDDEKVFSMSKAIQMKIEETKEFWKKPETVTEVSQYMEEAYLEMERFFHQLAAKHHHDPKEMMIAMKRQHWWDMSEEEKKLKEQDDTIYCRSYFFGSITEMYHLARGCSTIIDSPYIEGEKTYLFPELTEEDQAPYFKKGTPQYRWKELYNAFCSKIDEYGLRDMLEHGYFDEKGHRQGGDTRFVNWAKPDTHYVAKSYPFPDTTPT